MSPDNKKPTEETSDDKARYFNDMLTWAEGNYSQIASRTNWLLTITGETYTLIGTTWRIIIDDDGNLLIQYYTGGAWQNRFKFHA
ncbi:MAG: hypothetical protein IMZ53_10155 [Thermoplasmata archaeon]|nr:hypothetical protein [Thermoplasmata archaeon]